MILNMSQLCRLCLLKEDTMSAIFNDGKNSETADRIMACVSIEVSFFTGMLCPVIYVRAQDAFVDDG
jgi:hypothetical protein